MTETAIRQWGSTKRNLRGLLQQTERNAIRVADIEKHMVNGKLVRKFKAQALVPAKPSALRDWDYYAPNARKRRTVLVVDDDNEFDPSKLQEFGLLPNWVSINETNGHAQYTWYLKRPVYGSSEAKPVRYWTHISRALSHQLGGDPHFSRGLSRNPFYAEGNYTHHWQHDDRFGLNEFYNRIDSSIDLTVTQQAALIEDVDEDTTEGKRERPTSYVDEYGLFHRKMFLFDDGRFKAYRLRASGVLLTEREVFGLLYDTQARMALLMKEINDTREPLPRRTLETTARSITKWANERIRPGGKGSGASRYTLEQLQRGGDGAH